MGSLAGTVFIVDDVREVRAALTRLLGAAGHPVRAFESAGRFLDEQDVDSPGCLLLDVCMPGLTGLELQSALVTSFSARPIIFLTGMEDISTSVQAMKMGAFDFLTKPIDAAALLGTVDQALRRDAQNRLEHAIRHTIDQRIETLTHRERQVMAHVIRGRLNKQIAADLGTGEKTVKVHRAQMMYKMRVQSVPELIRLSARVGIAMEPVLHSTTFSLEWTHPREQ